MFLRTLITSLSLFAFAPSVVAQPLPCTKREDLVNYLGEKYKEATTGRGIAGEKSLIEIYVSAKGSFTIISSYGNGISCIIAAGQNWENMEPPPKDLTAL